MYHKVLALEAEDIVALVKAKDVQGLRSALRMDDRDSKDDEALISGETVRATITNIAIMPRYNRELVDLALELAVPWVDPWILASHIDVAAPYARVYGPYDKDELIEHDIDSVKDKVPKMTEEEVINLLRYLCTDEVDSATKELCEAIARRVFELSRKSCFFKSGQRTLLVYAGMVPPILEYGKSNNPYKIFAVKVDVETLNDSSEEDDFVPPPYAS